jgi:hypothetical protein
MSRFAFLAVGLSIAATAVAAPAPTPADAAFAALDANHDGALSPAEFRAGHAALQRALEVQARLRQQFAVVDADRSGAIEAGEYARMELVRRAGAAAPSLSTFDADRNAALGFA